MTSTASRRATSTMRLAKPHEPDLAPRAHSASATRAVTVDDWARPRLLGRRQHDRSSPCARAGRLDAAAPVAVPAADRRSGRDVEDLIAWLVGSPRGRRGADPQPVQLPVGDFRDHEAVLAGRPARSRRSARRRRHRGAITRSASPDRAPGRSREPFEGTIRPRRWPMSSWRIWNSRIGWTSRRMKTGLRRCARPARRGSRCAGLQRESGQRPPARHGSGSSCPMSPVVADDRHGRRMQIGPRSRPARRAQRSRSRAMPWAAMRRAAGTHRPSTRRARRIRSDRHPEGPRDRLRAGSRRASRRW